MKLYQFIFELDDYTTAYLHVVAPDLKTARKAVKRRRDDGWCVPRKAVKEVEIGDDIVVFVTRD